jgi:hypothetical protein
MDRSQIPPGLAKARSADIAKIPFHTMKAITPAELPLRLLAYDHFAARSRRPGLEADLAHGYRQLATEVLTAEDPRRAAELFKTAGVAPSYSLGQMQTMLAAGTAIRLSDGRIIPGAGVRDVRYAVTIAQAGMGRRTAEDSAAFRNWLQRRARALGVTLPQDWGRPSAPAVGPSTTRQNRPMPGNAPAGKSAAVTGALAKAAPTRPRLAPGQWRVQGDDGGPEVVVNVPVLDGIASDSAKIIEKAGNAGQLGALGAEISAIAKAVGESAAAARYRRKAAVVSDPQERKAYLELAAEAERAGAR